MIYSNPFKRITFNIVYTKTKLIMIPQNLKILQLTNCDGEYSGLYLTLRDDIENFQSDFDAAFSNRDVEDIHTNADDWLETHKEIYRVSAEIVTTDAI